MSYDWLIGRQRVSAAVTGTPDCVPIYAALTEHARYLFGLPAQAFYTTPQVFVEAQLLVSEYYGLDLPAVHGDVINIEAEALGRKVIYRPRSAPLLEPASPLYATRQDVDAIPEIDPHTAGRMPFMLEVYRLVGERTGLPAERWFTAPFSLLCAVQGYERVVRDAAHDPDFLHHLLATLRERVLLPWIHTSLRHALPTWAATGDDPWASFPIITPKMYDQFVLPEVIALQESLRPEGYRIAVLGAWGDARADNPTALLEERVRLQGALRGLDPDVQRLGPELYAQVANQHGVALGLGLDSRLIHDGPVEAIVARVKDYIHRAARNGRLTLMINNVPGNTPPEHIHAAVAAARLYGLYPIADRLDQVPFVLPEFEPFAEFARRRSRLAVDPVRSLDSHE
jgi:uroporphyrinogen-III decarboxylase